MDLIGVERRYRNRILIAITILIVVLLIIAFFYTKTLKNYKEKQEAYKAYTKQYSLAQKIQEQEKQKKQQIISEMNQKKQQIENAKKGSNLTQKGKENISNIYKSETKRAFLTFDDGPSKTVTIPILDLLQKENIKATFFVLGGRVELYPDIVKREYNEGHYIANHGYSHEYSQIYSSPQAVVDEFYKTNTAVQNAIGKSDYNSHLFRFPGGRAGGRYANIKNQAAQMLDEKDIAYVDWNCLTGDAEGKNTVEAMMEEIKNTSHNRNSLVILMHDAGNKQKTYEALPYIIQYLREQGYEFKNFYDVIE